MSRMHCLWTSFLALAGAAFPAFAAESLRIPRATHEPQVEEYVRGVPDDAGVEVPEFRQNTPGDGTPSSLPTRAFLSYDDDHLYVVFVCKDDPKLMRARISRREDIFGDEGVQIFLDTYDDNQRAFVFAANPHGVQLDSRLTEGLGYDFNFDTQWTSDGMITDDGYVVRMSIPFRSLRFERGPKQVWGAAVSRIIPRANEFSYWPFITQTKEGFVPQFGTIEIDDAISPGRNIQVVPHVSYRNTRALEFDQAGVPEIRTRSKGEVGVDAKFVIQDSLAVDLTVNPDFNEVESDEPQVIVNQRFEVQFPEKRPFFLENAGFFGTPATLFFSRRIVDPQYGARMTGRVGRWALGGLLIDDEAAGLFLPANDDDFGNTADIAVARAQRDFGKQSNIGVLVTNRDLGDHQNLVTGLDTRVKLNDNWTFTAQAVDTKTERPEAPTDNGHLWFGQFTRSGRSFSYDAQYIDISDDFQSDLGFIPRTNIKQLYNTATYLKFFPDAPWLISAGPTVTAYRTWDQRDDLQDWSVDSGFAVNGLNQTKFDAHWIESYELFAGERFRKQGWSLLASSELSRYITGSLKYSAGDAINYIPAEGLVPYLGDGHRVDLTVNVNPHPQLRIEQSLIWSELRTQDAIDGIPGDSNIFRDVLSRTKFKYQFSRFWAAHLIVDYAATRPDEDLISLTHTKRLTGDVLVSYVLNPGTTLYFGYTDRKENLRLFGDPREIERTDGLDLNTGRQVFIKLSYLFDF